ncbi:MAG: branched-chain amino acid transporter permease [Agathobaculum sp.]|jgi:branched-subunit amino acid transport protein AzlD|uniref:branched-chain amino acid transporter permease n=1 Tax=Agathobaculum sp. TaxID=2048138 RepID=UPI003D925149
MTFSRTLAMIAVAAVCTFATRLAPFLLFNGKKPIPPIIRYLGATLPPAVIALLVVYCLKNVQWITGTHGIPELLCIAVTALLHLWKRNNLLSIGVGTVLYMFLIQNIFL